MEKIMRTIFAFLIGLLFAATAAFAQEGLQDVQYDKEGRFAVQVEAWRSEVKADRRASFWKDRGFEHTRFIKHGNEATGDIWFRVHLGRFSNINDARFFQTVFAGMYNDKTWITTTNGDRPLITYNTPELLKYGLQ